MQFNYDCNVLPKYLFSRVIDTGHTPLATNFKLPLVHATVYQV